MTGTSLTPPGGDRLPIDPLLPAIVEGLSQNPNLILKAPPGAGKTTRVPPALLASGEFEGRILMLEPRRVAARAAARRIAEEWGFELGGAIGYRMRFERREGAGTRILVMTEGTLLAWLHEDPFLEGVSAVLFDEIHERSLDADLGLALCRRVQNEARPDLALVAMSATLTGSGLSRSLGWPTIESDGRSHPVAIDYLPSGPKPRRSATGEVVAGVLKALAQSCGHVLVFLPGVGEIHRTAEALGSLAEDQGIAIEKLYGSLPSSEQDAVLRPSIGRKIVLATNVAETSVTIPGVGAVVDSGLARILRFDPGRGLDRLELTSIARDSANQRAGRAGREGPGYCLRLWSETEQNNRLDHLPPEIHRVDLAGAALQLLAWGENDLEAFPWIEPPSAGSLAAALDLLTDLEARTHRGLTPLGRRMARLPLAPRLARLLLTGRDLGIADQAALAASLLSERDPFRRPDRDAAPPAPGDSDLEPRIAALLRFEAGSRPPTTPYGPLLAPAARQCLRVAKQLRRGFGQLGTTPSEPPAEESLSRALLTAFPDRVARRREAGERALMVGQRGLRLGSRTAVRNHELLLVLAVRAGRRGARSEAVVDLAVALRPEWLPTTVQETAEVDPEGRVRGYRRMVYRDLVLEELEIPLPDRTVIEAALVEAAAGDPGAALDLEAPKIAQFLARIRCLSEWRPELELPEIDDQTLRSLLPSLAIGCRSLEDLRRAPLLDLLRGVLLPHQQQALDREAPSHIRLPSGRRQRLDYAPNRPPILAARIQQLFGLSSTPTVGGGAVRVLLHLLAPNGRPQQITDDLAGFWTGTYAEVRKGLRGRYPKHAWPEDPMRPEHS